MSLFPNLICYGLNQSNFDILVAQGFMFMPWCIKSNPYVWCQVILFKMDITSWCYLPLERLMFACFCVLAHEFNMAHIPKTSHVVWLIIIYVPALMLIQHGSVGELGFTHLLPQPCWCVIFGHSTCRFIMIELEIPTCFWMIFKVYDDVTKPEHHDVSYPVLSWL